MTLRRSTVIGAEAIKTTLDGDTGYGLEMLPEELSDDIIQRVWQESWCRQSFKSVSMTTITLKIPKITGGMTMYGKHTINDEAATETRHTTTDIELDMRTVIGNAPIEKKIIAYAVKTLLPSLEEDIRKAVAEMEENMFVNGDTTTGATNINGVYNAVNFPDGYVTRDPRLEFDGLRHFAIAGGAVVNASGQALTQTHIRRALAQLGRHGIKKSEIIILMSLTVSTTVMGWSQLLTIDKYGPKATILTGEIGKVFGCTVIASDLVPDTLDANAVARNQSLAGTNMSVVLVFNKTSPIIGNPARPDRKFRILLDEEIVDDEIALVPIEDIAFANKFNEAICYIRNVLPGTT
jgi:hypothetical protein